MKATGKLIGLVLVLLAPVLLLYVTPGTALEWVNVTDERLLNADRDPSNWLTFYRTYNGWRYSPLSQVNRQTVQRLVPKWIFSLGEVGDQEATPVNLLIAKQRNGPTGDVFLTFLKSCTRFESAAKISSEDIPADN